MNEYYYNKERFIMENVEIGQIIIVIVTLIFSALFSSAETAYSSVNKIRLKNYAAQGNKKAEKALRLANKYEDMLTAVLIGNNIVNITNSSVSTVIFISIFGAKGSAISTVVVTILVLMFGEVLPKSYAKKNAEKLALIFASPLSVLIVVFKPFVLFFNALSSVFKGDDSPSVTEDELKYMIDEIEEQGVIEEQESDLVKSALEFDDITVSEILIPRVKIIGIEVTDPVDDILNIFNTEMYSRLPVYDTSLDNILGIITNKAFFKMLADGKTDIKEIIQEVPHIAASKLISQAMRDMQRSKVHLAVVTDQYGGTEGIVTLEDIIEELVGEIYDEDDEIITNIVKTGDNTYEIAGDTNICELLEYLDFDEDLIQTSCATVGGWATDVIEHIPEAGETAETGIFKIRILAANELAVEKILLEINTGNSDDKNSDENADSKSE